MFEPKNRKRLTIIGISVVLLALSGVMGSRYLREDPVQKVRDMRNQLFSDAGKKLDPEMRKEAFQKLRESTKSLTPQQRKVLFSEQQKQTSQKLADFFKLPAEERQNQLDKDIDRMQAARKRRESGQGGGVDDGGRGPGGGRTGNNNAQANASQIAGAGNTAALTASGTNGPGGARKSTPEQRESRRQTMLDYTTPEFRAMMVDYRTLMADRMKQRGITPPANFIAGPGFGGFGVFRP